MKRCGKSLIPGPLLLRSAGWEAERKRRPAGGGRHRPLTPPVTAWRGHKEHSQRRAPPPEETRGGVCREDLWGKNPSWNSFATELLPKAAAPGQAVNAPLSGPPGSWSITQREKGSLGLTAIPEHPGSRGGLCPHPLDPGMAQPGVAQPGLPDSRGHNRSSSQSRVPGEGIGSHGKLSWNILINKRLGR